MDFNDFRDSVLKNIGEIIDGAVGEAAAELDIESNRYGNVVVPDDKADRFYGAVSLFATLDVLERYEDAKG